MAKIKIKKADVWIDMTPMSDVMVLLLTLLHADVYIRQAGAGESTNAWQCV